MVHYFPWNGGMRYGPQVHHGSATTTATVRRAIQNSEESLRALSQRSGIDQSEHGGEVEEAHIRRRSSDRPDRATFNGAVAGGGNDRRRVPQARYCLWTIVSTRFSRRSRVSRHHPCIGAFNGMASPACRTLKATRRRRRSSRATRSASSISILPRCRRQKAGTAKPPDIKAMRAQNCPFDAMRSKRPVPISTSSID